MQVVEFPVAAEFTDRFGVVRSIAICSFVGREEFFERLTILAERFAGYNQSWDTLYETDRVVRHNVKRCLELSGISPDWVTFEMVETLLFRREGEEGLLVALNTPKTGMERPGEGEPMTLAKAIAILSTHTGNLEEAISLAQRVPAPLLMEILQERSELLKSPEERKKDGFDRHKQILKERFKQMQSSTSSESLQEVW